ncbi:AraC family transcriptional regulator [uncultured Victivallis sp.]|uniref:helix-turn-helix domain-containing protein n=1 Tax=uncultured Victivallis sp. TaxID=354118 RepID=UPI0025EC323E|nr:AraC family transcriptional regulator [uncultured Victivallis sp.]
MKKMELVELIHAGRFVSRGRGRHITRIIDSYELIFVQSGTLEMFEAERNYAVPAGSFLLLHPGLRHGGLSAYGNDLVFFWCHFLPRGVERKARLEAMDTCRAVVRPERMGEYFQLLLSELREVGSGCSADLLAELLLAEAERISPAAEADDCVASELASRAKEYIILHFEESLSTAVLGEALHCNPDYLNRVCHRSWGHTVTEEINLARLRYACRLLSQGKLSVKEIAFESGFNDPAYFRRRFRREFGLSPAEYRAAHSLGHVNTA